MRIPKTAVYYSRSEDAMRNGSYYRKQFERSPQAVQYMNGDYMGPVELLAIPEGFKTFTRDQAKTLLPKCCA